MHKRIEWKYIEQRLLKAQIPATSRDEIISKLLHIDRLKKEKQIILLAHYYQILPIQLIAYICGDSLFLAKAYQTIGSAKIILSSTVYFMAEMVKLFNPEKKVIIPDLEASCSIAMGMNASVIKKLKSEFPSSAIVTYVNSTLEVKACSDVICTSANAKNIITKIAGNPVIVLPDHYLAENIISEIPEKSRYLIYRRIEKEHIVLYKPLDQKEIFIPLQNTLSPELSRGVCVVHDNFEPRNIEYLKNYHHVDLVLAHPEVRPEVAKQADMIGGTSKMIDFVKSSSAKKILYLSECDLAVPLIEAYPDREFITPCFICPYMKKNTLDNVIHCLENETHEVTIDQTLAQKAKTAFDRMFELS